MDRTIALISLGCAKNLVNSEQMLYLLDKAGYAIAPEPDGADAVIINTCGFIDAAKTEAAHPLLPWDDVQPEQFQMLRLSPLPTDRATGGRPLPHSRRAPC